MPGRFALALLAPFAGAGLLLTAVPPPVLAESPAATQTPEDAAAARADLRAKAVALEAQLSVIVAELETEIATQEGNAGFGASEDTLSRIDGLKTRRDAFAAQLDQVRALIADLDKDP